MGHSSVPSQAVDEAWHEFILFTHHYQDFCAAALGRYLHHIPAEAMRSATDAQVGIRRAWRLACELEGIQPQRPHRLPRLFALDAELDFENGFVYSLDCIRRENAGGRSTYCVAEIGCAAGSGGCGGGISCGGDGGGDGGDGGGGCSGGGCGGCGGD